MILLIAKKEFNYSNPSNILNIKSILEDNFFVNRRILGSTMVVNKISRFRKLFKFIDFVGFNI